MYFRDFNMAALEELRLNPVLPGAKRFVYLSKLSTVREEMYLPLFTSAGEPVIRYTPSVIGSVQEMLQKDHPLLVGKNIYPTTLELLERAVSGYYLYPDHRGISRELDKIIAVVKDTYGVIVDNNTRGILVVSSEKELPEDVLFRLETLVMYYKSTGIATEPDDPKEVAKVLNNHQTLVEVRFNNDSLNLKPLFPKASGKLKVKQNMLIFGLAHLFKTAMGPLTFAVDHNNASLTEADRVVLDLLLEGYKDDFSKVELKNIVKILHSAIDKTVGD